MPFRAAFFDAGNTLLALDYAAIARRIHAAGHPATEEAVRRAEPRARVRLDPHLGRGRSTEGRDTLRLYLGYLFEDLGLTWDDRAEGVVDDLRQANRPYGLWCVGVPEAPAVLDRLRRRGLRLAVVSNSDGTVAEILRSVGLAEHVDVIVDSTVVGVEKPDPRIFGHAAALLGVAPAEAVHVGDLYSVDVLGARAAGCRAILMDPVGAWPPLDCPKAQDLSAAAALIEAMA